MPAASLLWRHRAEANVSASTTACRPMPCLCVGCWYHPLNSSASLGLPAPQVVGEGDSEYNSMPTGPLDELNNMMQALTAEIDDRHLIILDVLGQGGFGTVYKVGRGGRREGGLCGGE